MFQHSVSVLPSNLFLLFFWNKFRCFTTLLTRLLSSILLEYDYCSDSSQTNTFSSYWYQWLVISRWWYYDHQLKWFYI
jgi:hypothetical protein